MCSEVDDVVELYSADAFKHSVTAAEFGGRAVRISERDAREQLSEVPRREARESGEECGHRRQMAIC